MTDHEQYTISELADEASVSVRTIRYYIAEGLLPPPIGGGARSAYTSRHLDRLRLIARLKESYLPLREIRKHLSSFRDDLRTDHPHSSSAHLAEHRRPPSPTLHTQRLVEEFADYGEPDGFIDGIDDIRAEDPSEPGSRPAATAAGYIENVLSTNQFRSRPARTSFALHPRQSAQQSESGSPAPISEAWRRIDIADGAELLIREDAYQRRREKVDWLVEWARKVLD